MAGRQVRKLSQNCRRMLRPIVAIAFAIILTGASVAAAQTPSLGTKAPGFSAMTPGGQMVKLSDLNRKSKVVLVILRGYPGYQCPYCVRQVHDFTAHAAAFRAAHASVLLVYPGPPASLDAHAKEFLALQQAELPADITLVTDPDYTVTNRYGLRWDAPGETAYPSTFILDQSGTVLFEKVSRAHGDRTTAEEILGDLKLK